MTVCCVEDCGSNTIQKGISFFRFPKIERAPEKYQAWVDFVKISGWTPNDSSRICSLHFRGSQTYQSNGRLLLKESAIPSVRLDDDDTDSEPNLVKSDENNDARYLIHTTFV